MKHKNPTQVFDEIAQTHLGRDINLSLAIQAKLRKEHQRKMNTKKLATLTITLAIAFGILFSIPSVAQAMRRLFGFLPGIGRVEQSVPLRVLAEPVQSQKGETTLRVEWGVIDSEKTVLLFKVENLPAGTEAGSPQMLCKELPWLRLPDGTIHPGRTESGDFWGSGYSRRMEFSPLPATLNQAVLVLPCFEQAALISGAEAWEMPLRFMDAAPQMTVYPIVDLPTPISVLTALPASTLPQDETSLAEQLSLVLEQTVQTDEAVILMGALTTDSDDFRIQYVNSEDVHLVDGNGKEIPLEEDPALADPQQGSSDGRLPLTYRTTGTLVPGQATFSVDRVWVGLKESVVFPFDPGANPQPGQKWSLNQSVEIGGTSILIREVTLNETGDGLTFTLDLPEDVSELSLMDFEHPLLGGGGPGEYGFTYQDGFPSGVINVSLTGVSLAVEGPWQARINLPAVTAADSPMESTQVCLTASTWQAALESTSSAIPDGLSGKLVFSNYAAPDFLYHVRTSNLDGSNETDLGLGNDGSLFPDQEKVVYASEEGLQMINLASGQASIVSGSTARDHDPFWSPDGTKILFTRPANGTVGALGPSNLMLVDADGSNPVVLLENADANIGQGWMPDGVSVLYTVKGVEGAAVHAMDVETGMIRTLFDVNYVNSGMAVSADGKRLAYENMLPGDRYAVYVSQLDGSKQSLIADADPIVVTHPLWSPDGEWLMLSVQDTVLSPDIPVLALVNVETCQIIPLIHLTGYVTSWK